MDVPEEQLRLLHVGLLLRRRGPSRAAGRPAGDRELLLGQVEPAVVLEAELLLDGLEWGKFDRISSNTYLQI